MKVFINWLITLTVVLIVILYATFMFTYEGSDTLEDRQSYVVLFLSLEMIALCASGIAGVNDHIYNGEEKKNKIRKELEKEVTIKVASKLEHEQRLKFIEKEREILELHKKIHQVISDKYSHFYTAQCECGACATEFCVITEDVVESLSSDCPKCNTRIKLKL